MNGDGGESTRGYSSPEKIEDRLEREVESWTEEGKDDEVCEVQYSEGERELTFSARWALN